jgi:HK97 family phage major capsid protein
MGVGSDASAGYLVPDELGSRVIDKARNLAVVSRAGALTVPMRTNELHLARLTGDATASWKAENASGTASDLTFERVTLRSRTLIALVKASVELFEDSEEIEETIENSFAEALALELDRAALRGSGVSAEPLGIRNQTGVRITGSIGTPSDYVSVADTPTQTLREAYAQEPYAFVAAPRTFGSLEKLVTGISGDKTRLAAPPAWQAYRRFSSNQVPTNLGSGSDESEAYIGDFAQVILGMRTTFRVEASRDAADSSGGAFGDLQVWLRAYLRADVALAHPDHFNVLTGITAS